MLEQVPYCVAENLIHRLASAEFCEFGRIHGLTDELEKLKRTIESINDFLLDADDKQEQVRVQIWIRRLKEVLYRADDFIDDLAIEDMRRKVYGGQLEEVTEVLPYYSSSNRIAYPIQLADEIIKIQETFDDVVEDMFKLNLSPRTVLVKQANSVWRETSSFVLESNIIGRDDSKKEIVSLLRQPNVNQNVSVIAIVGIGGLGKTALAQLVYNDLEVQKFFEQLIWVCVSDNFHVKTVVRKILESITGSQSEDKLSLDNLQNKLRENLSGKKYLLVLDDIWNENSRKWEELRTYLMCGGQDSKVLATTRSEIVANTMSTSTSYHLRGLTEEESWSLLKNIAFGDDTKRVNQSLYSIGKEIAKKCKGVPLAINTLGGLLQWENEENTWEDVLYGDIWKLCEDVESIMPILKLSYQNLSPQLRQCFAYCSLYSKDSTIYKDELIQLWMAQGYLNCSTEKQHMEDVGNRYVKTFLMKSFFQDAKCKYGDIISFKMHDLMHDLAMLVAGNDYCYLDSKAKGFVGRPMHVSLERGAVQLLYLLDSSRLRTLILWSFAQKELPDVSNFRYLRVLKRFSSSSCKFSDSIGNLKHLRYLELVYVPKSISNLICLQTLILRYYDEEIFIKAVKKLVNLRCLYIYGSLKGMPPELEKLSSLQFLPTFVVGYSKEREYGTLNGLKGLHYLRGKLQIVQLNQVRDVALESQDVNLKEKNLLKSLRLDWEVGQTRNHNSESLQLLENLCPHHNLKQLEVHGYPGVIFSNWLSFLTNIVEISLCCLSNCQCLPPLECLPSLKSVIISALDELEYMYLEGFAVTFYPSLESLILMRCPKLRGWRRLGNDISDTENSNHLSLPSFPRLSKLEISECIMLTCMPTFPNVTELNWEDCDMEPLIATLNPAVSICSTDLSSFAAPLSMLKNLTISNPLNIQALPKDWMQNLISLEFLRISSYKSQTFPQFETCFKADSRCLPSLQKIRIAHCGNIKALPDWICSLSSLQICEIIGCDNLASLPEGMPRLTNLKILDVAGCYLLRDEYRKDRSAIRRLIAHIPKVIPQNFLS